jgi:hypothetical protein
MSILLLPTSLALLAVMLLTRSLSVWGREPVRWWPVAGLAIVTDLILARIPTTQVPWLADWGHWLWVGELLAIAIVLLMNAAQRRAWRRAPWLIAALGVGLNLLVVFANGGYMPVDTAALDASGISAELADRPRYRRDVPVDQNTRLAGLADVVLDPGWLPRGGVVSIGDMVLVLGLVSWVAQSALLAPRPSRTRPV